MDFARLAYQHWILTVVFGLIVIELIRKICLTVIAVSAQWSIAFLNWRKK